MACNSCNACNSNSYNTTNSCGCGGRVQGINFPDFVANSCCNPCCENAVAGQSTGGCGCGCGGNVAGTSCGCGCGGNICNCMPWLPGCNARD